MALCGNLVVYEWQAWDGFLIRSLFPGAARITAYVAHDSLEIVRRIPQGTSNFLFHVNCSLTKNFPHQRRQLVRHLQDHGITPINAAVTDITKRSLQDLCESLGLPCARAPTTGTPDELLIVKTNLNAGGKVERRLTAAEFASLDLPPMSLTIRGQGGYLVRKRSDVPADWWHDQSLTIERFITNNEDRFFRIYVFLEHVAVQSAISRARLKSMGQSEAICSTHTHGLSARLSCASCGFSDRLVLCARKFISGSGLEYGAFDMVVDSDGAPFVIDLNTTPYLGDYPWVTELVTLLSGV